jgi:cytosine deaminase
MGLLLAHAAQLGSPGDQAFVLEMCTRNAARAMGLGDAYGIEVGRQADLLIVDTHRVADVVLDLPARLWVIKNGAVTVETQHSCRIHRAFRKDLAS